MANFINYIIDSPIQPIKTNVLWVKKGVLHYYNKKWIPILGNGSGGLLSPFISGEGEYSAILDYSNNKALNTSSIALGYNLISNNFAEASFGKYNVSVKSEDPSLSTLFSVGNGSEMERKNAFEIKADGEIYIGKREESLQAILYKLEKISYDEKYHILETQFKDLDAYTKTNIATLIHDVSINTSSILNLRKDVNINSINIESLNAYLEDLKLYIDAEDNRIESSIKDYKTLIDGSILELNTRISQTAEEIRLEAEKTKEEIDGKLLEFESSLSLTAEEILAEVSRVEKDANDKIVEANSLISQTAESIRSEVSRIETDVDGRIKDSNSRIDQTAEEIRSEVYEITTTLDEKITENHSEITQTANEINLKVEGVESFLNNKASKLEAEIEITKSSINLQVKEIEDLQNKVKENTSNIALNTNAIELKVDSDTFDLLSAKVEDNTANIALNSNKIASLVTKKEFDALTGEVRDGFTQVTQTIDGITSTIQSVTGEITTIKQDISGLTVKTETLEADIESLRKQSDGTIDTHFGTETPSLDNEPAVNWDTEELKKEHTGDIYYNNLTGEAYRWSYDPESQSYFWVELTDSALTDALDKINKLEEAIDGKVTIFYTRPSAYKQGDIWFVEQDYPDYHFVKGQMLSAIENSDYFDETHWEDKTNYASYEEVEESIVSLNDYIEGAFKDDILTLNEINQIKEAKKNFESIFSEVEQSYIYLIVSSIAADADKEALEEAYNALTSTTTTPKGSYVLLIETIDEILDDSIDEEGNFNKDTIEVLLEEYEETYNKFLEDLTNYYNASAALNENVQSYLNSASVYIENITSDSVLTPIEKKQLFEIWRQLAEEFNTNRGIAFNYKLLSKEEDEYVTRTDIYPEDSEYHRIYEAYKASFDAIKTIFTSVDEQGNNIWGFDSTNIESTTDIPEKYTTQYISNAFDNYYSELSKFSQMISEITISITDSHEKAKEYVDALSEQLTPEDNISIIGKGVILSSIIGVKNSEDDSFISAINAQSLDTETIITIDKSDERHGRIVYAGGIPSTNDWNDSTTVIYEDGHVKFKSGEITDDVYIGENREFILDIASKIKDNLRPGEENTVLSDGLILSTVIGVTDADGNIIAAINASESYKDDSEDEHGRIVFAGGIDDESNWNDATVRIYEDGHVVMKSGEIGEEVEIGNALIKAVSTGRIDLLSYPETVDGETHLIPLFQVNTDNSGRVISISSLYDFIGNKNIFAYETLSSGGVGEPGESGGDIDPSGFVTSDEFEDQLTRINNEIVSLSDNIYAEIRIINEWIANVEENGSEGGSVVYYTGLTDGLRIGAITIDEVSTDVFIPANLSEYTIDSDFVNALSVEGFITEVDANNKYALQSALDDFLPKDAEASSAARLSDEDEYTAFGRTFFSNGKPVNITSSPIAPANGGLYAYDYNNNSVLLFFYANGGDFSELRIGSEPASRGEDVRICGYPLIMHHGSVNAGDVVAKTTVDGIVVPAGRKLYLGDDNGYHITMEYDEVTDAIRIDGNVYVTGTVASGGKAEEGDSPLADLEERVSRLENLIS